MSVNNSFQKIITSLQSFWIDQGCVLLQPYDLEVGAGTFHPATVLRVLVQIQFGRQRMFNLVDDQLMEDMVKILIDFSIIINFRSLLNHLLMIYKIYI